MNRKARRWDALASRFKKDDALIGAEVGVWDGQMSGHLLRMLPSLQLHMIDRWTPPEPQDSYYDSDTRSRSTNAEFVKAMKAASDVASRYPDRAKLVIAESVEAAERYPDGFFDFVFIDADHTYAGVLRDIAYWTPLVRAGGLFCGHDYGNPGRDGVKRALDMMVFKNPLELGPDHTWFVRF